jgi:hypothetical protein
MQVAASASRVADSSPLCGRTSLPRHHRLSRVIRRQHPGDAAGRSARLQQGALAFKQAGRRAGADPPWRCRLAGPAEPDPEGERTSQRGPTSFPLKRSQRGRDIVPAEAVASRSDIFPAEAVAARSDIFPAEAVAARSDIVPAEAVASRSDIFPADAARSGYLGSGLRGRSLRSGVIGSTRGFGPRSPGSSPGSSAALAGSERSRLARLGDRCAGRSLAGNRWTAPDATTGALATCPSRRTLSRSGKTSRAARACRRRSSARRRRACWRTFRRWRRSAGSAPRPGSHRP